MTNDFFSLPGDMAELLNSTGGKKKNQIPEAPLENPNKGEPSSTILCQNSN